jgi:hypothetical protein
VRCHRPLHTQDDRCECFQASTALHPTRAGWTGYDCSERLCPFGAGFASVRTQEQGIPGRENGARPHLIKGAAASKNVLKVAHPLRYGLLQDLSIEVEIIQVTGQGTGVLRYRVANLNHGFEPAVPFDSSNGLRTTLGNSQEIEFRSNHQKRQTGIVFYLDRLLVTAQSDINPRDLYFFNLTSNYGGQFQSFAQSSMHQPLECSGVGLCNRQTGMCQCFPGYTGDACSRSDCPNQCNGHGVCQLLKTFLSDHSVDYSEGFDATKVMTCKCDNGFRGADCSEVECPSGEDPLGGPGGAQGLDCSGRGACDYDTGLCKCDDGFFGIRCEERTTFV